MLPPKKKWREGRARNKNREKRRREAREEEARAKEGVGGGRGETGVDRAIE